MKDTEILDFLKQDKFSKAVKGLYAFYPGIKKLIKDNNGTKEDAEDVFQETLLVLYRKVQKNELVLSSALKTYFTSISKNLWYNELRKRGKEISFVQNYTAETSIAEEDETLKKAEMAFVLLGKKCQELLVLFYFKKLNMIEIARQLEFSNEKVAKNQKYRCLEKAKQNYHNLLEN